MFIKKAQLQSDVQSFLGVTIALTIIGFLFIYSSSSVYALERFGISHYYINRQLLGLTCAFIALLFCRFISLNFLETLTPTFFLITFMLTAATLVPYLGTTIHGSSRWLNLRFLSLQPSELLKLTFVLYIARFLAKKEGKPFTFVNSYLPFLVIILIISGVLLKQPDFGLAVTLAMTAFMLIFIAGFPLKHLLLTGASAIPILGILIFTQSYRIKRILTFLDPWQDPQGAGFQIIQSLIAIGSGNWWGSGISHSKQKFFYLPMQHTDFIFSIIAEETGFIGASIVIFLYLLLLYFGCKIAWQLKKPFHIFATLGFTLLISLQAMINIFVATGLFPTKGIGLPFISYGNSALIGVFAMIGLILNMAAREYGYHKKMLFGFSN
jgi:cell division protein FtsW